MTGTKNLSVSDALKQTEPHPNFHLDNLREMFTSFIRHERDITIDHACGICATFEVLSDQLSILNQERSAS